MLCCMIWENSILLIYYGKPALSSFICKKRARARKRMRVSSIGGTKKNRTRHPGPPDGSGGNGDVHGCYRTEKAVLIISSFPSPRVSLPERERALRRASLPLSSQEPERASRRASLPLSSQEPERASRRASLPLSSQERERASRRASLPLSSQEPEPVSRRASPPFSSQGPEPVSRRALLPPSSPKPEPVSLRASLPPSSPEPERALLPPSSPELSLPVSPPLSLQRRAWRRASFRLSSRQRARHSALRTRHQPVQIRVFRF